MLSIRDSMSASGLFYLPCFLAHDGSVSNYNTRTNDLNQGRVACFEFATKTIFVMLKEKYIERKMNEWSAF